MNRIILALAALALAAPCYGQETRSILKGSTDQSVYIRIVDSADGTPETGVTSATAGLDLEYVRNRAAAADLTESDLAAVDSAHSDGGIKHVGNGVYRVDLPDAACASGVDGVLVTGTATDMVVIPARIQLTGFDLQDATPAADVTTWNGTAVASPNTAGYPVVTVKDGTGTGEINTASGVVDANATQVLGTALNDGIAFGGIFEDTIAENISMFFGSTANFGSDSAAATTISDVKVSAAAILDDTGTSGVVVAAGTEIEVADADLRAALGMAAADLDTQLDAIVADTGELQTDWVNGGRLDNILDARSSQSSVDTIDGIVDAILLDTAEIGTAGAGLSAIPWRAAWDAEVQSEVADALAAYDPPTKAEMDSGFAAISVTLSPEDIAAIAAAVDIDEASLTSAVWAYNSRTLTAGTNIVLAKGTGVTGFNDLDAAGIRSAVGLASANIDTQFSNISVTLSAQDIADIVDGIIEGGGGVTPVSADIVGDSYTWIGNRYRASNIVEVENGFTGALALKPDMNPGVTITTVNSVTITGAATVTATGLTVDRSRTVAQFTVPELTTEGTYTVRVEVTTVDGAEITTTATLKVY